MNIKYIGIQNFRKLKNCIIDFDSKQTVLVGSNNSGKTAMMDVLYKFLKRKSLEYNDISVCNRIELDKIGDNYLSNREELNIYMEKFLKLMPSIDIWLNVNEIEIYHVVHLMPSLDWNELSPLGVRYVFMPRDIENLFLNFGLMCDEIEKIMSKEESGELPKLSKKLSDYIIGKIKSSFTIKYYILDYENESKIKDTQVNYDFQNLNYLDCIDISDPLNHIIQVDMIKAQRGFSDQNDANNTGGSSLSNQLHQYYNKHLDPKGTPSSEDMKLVKAMQEASTAFDTSLKEKFKESIGELEQLGYPGFGNPKIEIKTEVNAIDALDHDSAVQYSLTDELESVLPERYNGLGYQNLISIVFLLISFRDSWLRLGGNHEENEDEVVGIKPIHLVLLEEPEAHLHIQAQQVFINKAYDILRNNEILENPLLYTTQLLISTHSSHIAKEVNFSNLRYFKKLNSTKTCSMPTSAIINLSDIFGTVKDTDKFVERYLKSTHCELFFADAAILVEGATERMLLPHFIDNNHSILNSRYVTILEINGRHAHRLFPLIKKIALNTLIITDLDPVSAEGNHKKEEPLTEKGLVTTNKTINEILSKNGALSKIDNIISSSNNVKTILVNEPYSCEIRITYQTPITVKYGGKDCVSITGTFEDSMIYSNYELFSNKKEDVEITGNFDDNYMVKEIRDIFNSTKSFDALHSDIFKKLKNKSSYKAEFALDLIYEFDPKLLIIPEYINEGLNWLEEKLKPVHKGESNEQ